MVSPDVGLHNIPSLGNARHTFRCFLQPGMESKFLAVGAGKQHRPLGIVDNQLDAPSAALMGEQMLAVQNTL